MKNKQRFIYITSYWSDTIVTSQILNWLELLNHKGISYELIVIANLKNYFTIKKKIQSIGSGFSRPISIILSYKSNSFIGQILIAMRLYLYLINDIKNKKTITVKTRNSINYFSLKILSRITKNLKIYFDSRGALAEEYKETLEKNNLNERYIQKIYKTILSREIKFIELSDKTYCISNELKKYYQKKLSMNNREKFFVIPGCADEKLFYWSEEDRKNVRKELGIDRNIVFVYSGKLDKAWQMPDSIFYFFSEFLKIQSDTSLLLLTPDNDIVQNKVNKYKIPSQKIIQRFVSSEKIRQYLCAADYGLLFRKNSLTNVVASPTKFPEYVMTGLPVIISENIGDFSNFVNDNNIGFVINNSSIDDKNLFKKISFEFYNRSKIAKLGHENFSKQKNIEKMV